MCRLASTVQIFVCGCYGQDGQQAGNGTLLWKGQSSVELLLQPQLQQPLLVWRVSGEDGEELPGTVLCQWVMPMTGFLELAVLNRSFQSSASHSPLSLQTNLPRRKHVSLTQNDGNAAPAVPKHSSAATPGSWCDHAHFFCITQPSWCLKRSVGGDAGQNMMNDLGLAAENPFSGATLNSLQQCLSWMDTLSIAGPVSF